MDFMSTGGNEGAGIPWLHFQASPIGEAVGSCRNFLEPGKDKGTPRKKRGWFLILSLVRVVRGPQSHAGA